MNSPHHANSSKLQAVLDEYAEVFSREGTLPARLGAFSDKQVDVFRYSMHPGAVNAAGIVRQIFTDAGVLPDPKLGEQIIDWFRQKIPVTDFWQKLPSIVSEAIYKIIEDTNPKSVLNVWSGWGEIALGVSEKFPDSVVSAVDPSSEAIELGELFDRDERVTWLHAEPNEWEFHPSGEFDIVVCQPPLGDSKSLVSAVVSATRISASGRVIVVCTAAFTTTTSKTSAINGRVSTFRQSSLSRDTQRTLDPSALRASTFGLA